MSNNPVLKMKKVERNGSPYWIVLEDRPNGTKYVVGYGVEWHIKDPSFAGENLGGDFDEVVKRFTPQPAEPKEEKKEKPKKSKPAASAGNESFGGGGGGGGSESSMGFCSKLIFTILLVLPIWWFIKVIIHSGWTCLKVLYYIISWPFRLIMCCCCNTSLIPQGTFKLPKYDFSLS